MPVKGLQEVLKRFDRAIKLFEAWNKDQVEKATLRLHQEVKTLSSVEDQHTLKVLREMGHPYAVRHVLPEAGDPQGPRISQDPHRGTEFVHVQTGKLLAALQDPKISGTKERQVGTVGIDENQSPHARWVIYGTSKMISRPFPLKAMENIQDEWWTLLKMTGKDLIRNLKSQR